MTPLGPLTGRSAVRLSVLVGLAFVVGGWLGAAVGLAAAGALAAGVRARLLLLGALGSVVGAALVWVVGNAGDGVSFALVTRNPWPHRFALAAVVLLLIGVFGEPAVAPAAATRPDRAPSPGADDGVPDGQGPPDAPPAREREEKP